MLGIQTSEREPISIPDCLWCEIFYRRPLFHCFPFVATERLFVVVHHNFGASSPTPHMSHMNISLFISRPRSLFAEAFKIVMLFCLALWWVELEQFCLQGPAANIWWQTGESRRGIKISQECFSWFATKLIASYTPTNPGSLEQTFLLVLRAFSSLLPISSSMICYWTSVAQFVKWGKRSLGALVVA